MEKTIHVHELTGDNACTMQAGDMIHVLLLQDFKLYDKIILDFNDIKHVTASFFNSSISRLLKDMTIDELKSKLTMIGLNDFQLQLLNLSIHNAILFFKGGVDGSTNE